MRDWKRALCSLLLAASVLLAGCSEAREVRRYQASFDAEGLDELVFSHGEGDLVVRGDPERRDIEVDARLRTGRPGHRHDAEAEHRVELVMAAPTAGTGELRFTTGPLPDGYFLDVEVAVPDSLALTIDDGSGDLVISNVGDLLLDDGSGDAVVENVAGSATITDGSGALVVRGVEEYATVNDDSGDLVVDGVGRDVVVDDGSGDLVVRDVGGDVSVADGSGDLVVENVTGHVVVRDGSGDIAVHHVGTVDIPTSGSGEVDVR